MLQFVARATFLLGKSYRSFVYLSKYFKDGVCNMQKKLTVFILLSMLFVMLVVCGSKNPFTNTSIESSVMFNATEQMENGKSFKKVLTILEMWCIM